MIKPASSPFSFAIRDADFPDSMTEEKRSGARFAMDGKGTVLYATPDMLELCGVAESAGLAAQIKIADSPRKKLHSLKDGVYALVLKKDKPAEPFRFDWVAREGGEKILIAARIEQAGQAPEMEGFVKVLEQRLQNLSTHPAAL
ncbi:MAG TPA: hypothetical protein PLO23_07730, partial [Alphaproteobacteria bacterium]|nr:hypothetical protein [Alphaproteobacteria bacterium]